MIKFKVGNGTGDNGSGTGSGGSGNNGGVSGGSSGNSGNVFTQADLDRAAAAARRDALDKSAREKAELTKTSA